MAFLAESYTREHTHINNNDNSVHCMPAMPRAFARARARTSALAALCASNNMQSVGGIGRWKVNGFRYMSVGKRRVYWPTRERATERESFSFVRKRPQIGSDPRCDGKTMMTMRHECTRRDQRARAAAIQRSTLVARPLIFCSLASSTFQFLRK